MDWVIEAMLLWAIAGGMVLLFTIGVVVGKRRQYRIPRKPTVRNHEAEIGLPYDDEWDLNFVSTFPAIRDKKVNWQKEGF